MFFSIIILIIHRCTFLTPFNDCSNPPLCGAGHGISVARVFGNDEGECSGSDDVTVRIHPNDRAGCIADTHEWGFSLEINANPDHTYNPRRQIVLQLATTLGDYDAFWANYELPRAVVRVDFFM